MHVQWSPMGMARSHTARLHPRPEPRFGDWSQSLKPLKTSDDVRAALRAGGSGLDHYVALILFDSQRPQHRGLKAIVPNPALAQQNPHIRIFAVDVHDLKDPMLRKQGVFLEEGALPQLLVFRYRDKPPERSTSLLAGRTRDVAGVNAWLQEHFPMPTELPPHAEPKIDPALANLVTGAYRLKPVSLAPQIREMLARLPLQKRLPPTESSKLHTLPKVPPYPMQPVLPLPNNNRLGYPFSVFPKPSYITPVPPFVPLAPSDDPP